MDTVMSGKNLRRGTAIAAALAAILAAVGYGWNTDASPAQPDGAPPVAVAAPLQRTVAVTRQYPGQVEAIERVELRPRVSGHILRVAFTEGSRVRKDQLLVQIDPAPYAAALAQAEAGHRQALAEASLAASEADRASRLASRNAISSPAFAMRWPRVGARSAWSSAALVISCPSSAGIKKSPRMCQAVPTVSEE